MLYPLLAAVLTSGTDVPAEAASFQERLARSPGAVLAPDDTPLPASVVLTRRWERDICHAVLENRGPQAVRVGTAWSLPN